MNKHPSPKITLLSVPDILLLLRPILGGGAGEMATACVECGFDPAAGGCDITCYPVRS